MKNLIRTHWGAAAVVLASLLIPSNSALANWQSANLVQRLERDGRFTTLLTALEVTGLKSTLATGGTFTLFAPTDAAFAALPPGTVESLVADPPALANILLYHALPGRESWIRLLKDSTAETLQGSPVLVVREGFKLLVNRQPMLLPWLPAVNGVIYPIGGVLLPPASPTTIQSVADVLALDGRFTTLLAAVGGAGLGEVLTTGGPFTLFAPTDEAFAQLPPGTVEGLLADPDALRAVLLYHVLGQRSGVVELLASRTAETLQGSDITIALRHGSVFVNESRLVNANVSSPNAIIHVIDRVLLPPAAKPNLVETLQADGRFGTLLTALQAAGLDAVLAEGGPFTVFAPTDAAFAKLPAGTVQALLADTDTLKNVLLYHVVNGDKSAYELIRERSAETLQGASVKITWWWGRVFVNRSEVVDADIEAGNGRIHAIGSVLLPPTQ
ncbi:MAG: fasciclin domain-containing protein [Verrucomicrobia bacterium]|nr:fasciclin domain-containing protein [Verrucomicrobiota bacterium]